MYQQGIIKYQTGQLQKLDNVLAITNKILEIDFRNLRIVHLDDHNIFRAGLRLSLKEKLPNILIKEFLDNEPALNYIEDCFKNKERIDLIITDYNHPGANGLIFAQEVRELQKYYSISIPVMLFTMRGEEELLFKATREGVFDVYFLKSAQPEELIDFVKRNTSQL